MKRNEYLVIYKCYLKEPQLSRILYTRISTIIEAQTAKEAHKEIEKQNSYMHQIIVESIKKI